MPNRSPMALCLYHSRCRYHSLDGLMSLAQTSSWRTSCQRVPLRPGGSPGAKNASNPNSFHSCSASQHAPHCRGRCPAGWHS